MSGPDQPRKDTSSQDDPAAERQPRPPAAGAAGLSRRRFFSTTGGAAAALALGGPAALAAEDAPAAAPSLATAASSLGRSATETYYQAFCEPRFERSQYGSLDTTLRVVPAEVSISEPGGTRVEQTRTYNGRVPGPTLRVQAGDRMNILLDNQLPPNTDPNCPPVDHNIPHCFNTTNLHTHGLHVSPEPPSDDVFLRLEPGTATEICIDIPKFHAAGTYWYHAHKHGSAALQLVNGLAGALVIEDPPSSGQVSYLPDRVMVMQEIIGDAAAESLYGPDLDGRIAGAEPDAPEDVYNCMGGSPCSLHDFTINGCVQPTLHLRPYEIQRWRVINATATPRGYTKLQVVGLASDAADVYLIAVDGIYLPKPRQVSEWLLVPGGRADFAVRFRQAGSYKLLRVPTQGQCQNQILVNVEVTGTPPPFVQPFPPPLPALPAYLDPITDEEWEEHGGITRELTFDVVGAGDPNVPCNERFRIDGESYDPEVIRQDPELGTVEKWMVTNTSIASHPFHIHVNPFQVIAIDEVEIPSGKRFWQDTVDLPPGTTVTFYTRILTFHGKFVLHCHILNHEDWGMMQNVEVQGLGYGPCEPVPATAGPKSAEVARPGAGSKKRGE